ncbi:MAG: hypothetical protein M3N13_08000, partial [Candidatus Eremiobacteraeota bacterium]|nr:hypothetical protein [Candidatus Eremiobacteraeota bacterium]
ESGSPCSVLMPDERTAIVNADGPGYSNLRRLDLMTGALGDLTPERGEVSSCSLSANAKTIAYLYGDSTHPGELYVADTGTGAQRALTHLNRAYLDNVNLSRPQEYTVEDSAGFTVHAWFMPATNVTRGSKHATIFTVHGGPQAQYGDTYFHQFQMWTSMGYNVIIADPRGSIGF